jgi:hypothetical protein
MDTYKDDEIVMIYVPEAIEGKYNEVVYRGRYVKVLETGYWYYCLFRWGQLNRVKRQAQVDKLENLLV